MRMVTASRTTTPSSSRRSELRVARHCLVFSRESLVHRHNDLFHPNRARKLEGEIEMARLIVAGVFLMTSTAWAAEQKPLPVLIKNPTVVVQDVSAGENTH